MASFDTSACCAHDAAGGAAHAKLPRAADEISVAYAASGIGHWASRVQAPEKTRHGAPRGGELGGERLGLRVLDRALLGRLEAARALLVHLRARRDAVDGQVDELARPRDPPRVCMTPMLGATAAAISLAMELFAKRSRRIKDTTAPSPRLCEDPIELKTGGCRPSRTFCVWARCS